MIVEAQRVAHTDFLFTVHLSVGTRARMRRVVVATHPSLADAADAEILTAFLQIGLAVAANPTEDTEYVRT